MKKTIILFFVLIVLSFQFYAEINEQKNEHHLLKALIIGEQWEKLPSIFLDESYRDLEDYFSHSKSIKFAGVTQSGRLTYKAKFSNQGEMGVITFDKKDGKYVHLKIRNQIRPLYFIEKFKKYRATDIRLTEGDALIHFREGYFYEPIPFKFLLIFNGKWEFSIRPNDEEERLTLRRKFKKDSFVKSLKQGIFILKDKNRDFLSRLAPVGEVSLLEEETQPIFNLYNEKYGIKIEQFNEYWYLPFSRGASMTLFRKEKQSLYIYSYNQDSSPDTQLVTSDDNTILLSYNHYKGLKLSFGTPETVDGVKLNIFYNPFNNFISGTVKISFHQPGTLHTLKLAEGLKLIRNLDMRSKGLNVFRKKENYYLMGSETDTLSLFFNGYIESTRENMEVFKTQDKKSDKSRIDEFYFLSKTQDFYPNPGEHFFKTDVTLNLPGKLNCLISGNLEEKTYKGRNIIRYSSQHSKGISLVCGDFKLIRQLDSKIPLNIYSSQSFKYSSFLEVSEIKEAMDFFADKFGSTHLSECNILLKRETYEGGISNTGFVIVNINPGLRRRDIAVEYTTMVGQPRIISPVLIRDSIEDHVLHELAHQWWGGLISWKTYRDVWLTEGLAHFSVLYYLKNHLSTKKFNRIIKKLKSWIYRYSKTGPIAYGTRLHSLENSHEAFQTVVYNKGAFVFLMLLDLVGQEDFLQRIRSVLQKYTYKSISSEQFIRQFCNNKKMLMKFFKKWVFSRKIPFIRFDTQAHVKNDKQFKISIKQLNCDFVFPLKIKVVTENETSYKRLVVKEKEQSFIINESSPIKSIKPVDSVTPVRIEK